MSHFNKKYNDGSYREHRQRSRNNNQRWQHSSFSKEKKHSYQNYKGYQNKYSHNNPYQGNSSYAQKSKIMIDQNIKMGSLKTWLIWEHQQQKEENSKNIGETSKQQKSDYFFVQKIVVSDQPPKKQNSTQSDALNQLKQKITPVYDIWKSTIKQYLNDTQFVEICRKNNSLAKNIRYGNSIIRYDRSSFYEYDKHSHKATYLQEPKNKKQYREKYSRYSNAQIQEPIFSRAYFKLWEILSLGILDDKINKPIAIANLAEGPGGFIQSLIDFRNKQSPEIKDEFYAITLKIEEGKTRQANDWSFEAAEGFFKKMKKLHGYKIVLSYGQTGDGNLLDIDNIEAFKTHVMQSKKAFLVTGDGGIECISDQEYHYQEVFNAKLFFAEILTCFKIQEIGGVFILKIYDLHFDLSKELVLLLCGYYEKVEIIKPLTSRPGNSEKYLLCRGFVGVGLEQIGVLEKILEEWICKQTKLSYFENKQFVSGIFEFNGTEMKKQVYERIEKMNQELISEQSQKITEGLDLIERHKGDKESIMTEIVQKRHLFQMSIAYKWCLRFGICSQECNIE